MLVYTGAGITVQSFILLLLVNSIPQDTLGPLSSCEALFHWQWYSLTRRSFAAFRWLKALPAQTRRTFYDNRLHKCAILHTKYLDCSISDVVIFSSVVTFSSIPTVLSTGRRPSTPLQYVKMLLVLCNTRPHPSCIVICLLPFGKTARVSVFWPLPPQSLLTSPRSAAASL